MIKENNVYMKEMNDEEEIIFDKVDTFFQNLCHELCGKDIQYVHSILSNVLIFTIFSLAHTLFCEHQHDDMKKFVDFIAFCSKKSLDECDFQSKEHCSSTH